MEEWKVIITHPNYAVSNLGRIKILQCTMPQYVGKIKEGGPNPKGYIKIILSKNGKKTTFDKHTLVALYFLGERPTGQQVNHKDGNKANNRLDNLEYVTAKKNMAHARDRLGVVTWYKGEANPNAKLTAQDIVEIRKRRAQGETLPQLAAAYGKSTGGICDIVNRKAWAHI